MSTSRISTLLGLMLLIVGCTHQHRPTSLQGWSRSLTEEETARCKQTTWAAAESPERWKRFQPERITTRPVKLDTRGIQNYLDQKRFDRVEVAIPSGGLFGWHGCFIGVTVARGTYEVLVMRESFWP